MVIVRICSNMRCHASSLWFLVEEEHKKIVFACHLDTKISHTNKLVYNLLNKR